MIIRRDPADASFLGYNDGWRGEAGRTPGSADRAGREEGSPSSTFWRRSGEDGPRQRQSVLGFGRLEEDDLEVVPNTRFPASAGCARSPTTRGSPRRHRRGAARADTAPIAWSRRGGGRSEDQYLSGPVEPDARERPSSDAKASPINPGAGRSASSLPHRRVAATRASLIGLLRLKLFATLRPVLVTARGGAASKRGTADPHRRLVTLLPRVVVRSFPVSSFVVPEPLFASSPPQPRPVATEHGATPCVCDPPMTANAVSTALGDTETGTTSQRLATLAPSGHMVRASSDAS